MTIEGYTAQVVGGGTAAATAASRCASRRTISGSAPSTRVAPICATTRTATSSARRATGRSATTSWSHTTVKAEKLVGINGTRREPEQAVQRGHITNRPLEPNPISRYVEIGMDALGMARYRTPLAVITAGSCAQRAQGRRSPKTGLRQPLRRPARAEVEHLGVAAVADPASDRTSSCAAIRVVTHLECERSERARRSITAIRAARQRCGRGKVVVVACSAIESVRLLMLSGEIDAAFAQRINRQRPAGRVFPDALFRRRRGDHAGPLRQIASRSTAIGPPTAAPATTFIRDNGLWAGGAIYNNTSDQALPISLARTHGSQDLDTIWKAFVEDTGLTGEALSGFFDDNFGTRLSVSFMANQVPLRKQPDRTAPDGARQVGPPGGLHHQGLAQPRPVPDGHAGRAVRGGSSRYRRRWRRRRISGDREGRRVQGGKRQRCGSPTTSWAARASATTRPIRCSTRTAAPGASIICTSPTAPSCRPRRRQPDADHPGQCLPRSGLLDQQDLNHGLPIQRHFHAAPRTASSASSSIPTAIYHAPYLNATRSPRYRYNVQEVRNQLDIVVLKGEVYLDGEFLSNFLRIEYRASRLVEQAREQGRGSCATNARLGMRTQPTTRPVDTGGSNSSSSTIARGWTPIRSKIWETLEPPPGKTHDYSVLDLMGRNDSITRVRQFAPALRDIRALKATCERGLPRERSRTCPSAGRSTSREWDNNYLRRIRSPHPGTEFASSTQSRTRTTSSTSAAAGSCRPKTFAPVRYRNAMMNDEQPRSGRGQHHRDALDPAARNWAARWSFSTK